MQWEIVLCNLLTEIAQKRFQILNLHFYWQLDECNFKSSFESESSTLFKLKLELSVSKLDTQTLATL